jgi:hypothetical protein
MGGFSLAGGSEEGHVVLFWGVDGVLGRAVVEAAHAGGSGAGPGPVLAPGGLLGRRVVLECLSLC